MWPMYIQGTVLLSRMLSMFGVTALYEFMPR